MRKPIHDSSHLKNRVLLLLFFFSQVPELAFGAITNDPKEREEIRLMLKYLLKQKLIIKEELLVLTVIKLSRKGYDNVVRNVLGVAKKTHLYAYKRKWFDDSFYSLHLYMHIAFVWDFLKKYPERINKDFILYTDTNTTSCKLTFPVKSRRVTLFPDILIQYPDTTDPTKKHIIIVEDDASEQTHKVILQKLIDYSLWIDELIGEKESWELRDRARRHGKELERGMQKKTDDFALENEQIKSITLYFTTTTIRRTESMFFSPINLFRLVTNFNDGKKTRDVKLDTFVGAYTDPRISLFVGSEKQWYRDNDYQFKKVDVRSALLSFHPYYKHLYVFRKSAQEAG